MLKWVYLSFVRTVAGYFSHISIVRLLFLAVFILLAQIAVCRKKGITMRCFAVIFPFYLAFMLELTLMSRTPNMEYRSLNGFFNTYVSIITGKIIESWQIVLNILLFIPYGILLVAGLGIQRKSAIKIIILTTMFIEVIQLIAGVGQIELADLMNNSIGGIGGAMLLKMSDRQKQKSS